MATGETTLSYDLNGRGPNRSQGQCRLEREGNRINVSYNEPFDTRESEYDVGSGSVSVAAYKSQMPTFVRTGECTIVDGDTTLSFQRLNSHVRVTMRSGESSVDKICECLTVDDILALAGTEPISLR